MRRIKEARRKFIQRAEEQVRYRDISPEQLKDILEDHVAWLRSEGKEGTKADLSRANLPHANLSYANLEQADLKEANLRHINFNDADLYGASLERAKINDGKLQNVSLARANLQGAELIDANLLGSKLGGANCQWANFSKANLQKANLAGADLPQANLKEANLQHADLTGTGLRHAELPKANLQNAKLGKADLRDTNLQNANLKETTSLLGGQLAGADVCGAALPHDIHKFHGVLHVEEASKNARKIFLAMLLGCLYSWLTIATTTDARLLTNSASSPLPIIGTAIPIVGFYLAAPILLLGLYIYFHLYLQRLWEGLAELPAVFPDGKALDKRIYPWLLNGLVRGHFVRLKHDRPALSRVQNAISILLAWCVVPATLLLFWGRYLRRHEWTGTSLHIGLLTISTGLAILFYLIARRTLRGQVWSPIVWKKALKDVRTYKRAVVVLGSGLVFVLLSLGAIKGVPPHKGTGIRTWVPRAFELIGYSAFADLEEVDVSTKPDIWTGDSSQIALVKGARLRGRDLCYIRANRAFLVNADLRKANLQGAILEEADLRGANLQWADLQRASLLDANLQRANLSSRAVRKQPDKHFWIDGMFSTPVTNLRYAVLDLANLQGADLAAANLEGAHLVYANLDKVDLQLANLQGANLERANLRGANLKEARLAGANLRWSKLQGANLFLSDLTKANLRQANLQGAYFEGARLDSAYLGEADLRGARGLTKRQIESAIIDEKTELPDYLK